MKKGDAAVGTEKVSFRSDKWDYSKYSDILNVHKRNRVIKGSAELGPFTIDFDKNGNIVGIEIMHASEFFEDALITPEILKSVKGARLIVRRKVPDLTVIFVGLLLPDNQVQQVAVPAPVLAKSR